MHGQNPLRYTPFIAQSVDLMEVRRSVLRVETEVAVVVARLEALEVLLTQVVSHVSRIP